jgi:ABC-type Zn2+ transport system substrate-binding protein/surface adhesin
MSRLSLALPFALMSLAVSTAYAHEHSHDEHGSLGKHEHGVASLNVALDGKTLEIALDSPAMNMVGFEHAPSSDADKAKIAQAQQQLRAATDLFGVPAAAGCVSDKVELESPLFSPADGHEKGDHKHEHGHEHAHADSHEHKDGHEHGHDHAHSDIDAQYSFTCADPSQLNAMDLSGFFKQFPATEKVNVQAIGPNGQKGDTLTPQQPKLTF